MAFPRRLVRSCSSFYRARFDRQQHSQQPTPAIITRIKLQPTTTVDMSSDKSSLTIPGGSCPSSPSNEKNNKLTIGSVPSSPFFSRSPLFNRKYQRTVSVGSGMSTDATVISNGLAIEEPAVGNGHLNGLPVLTRFQQSFQQSRSISLNNNVVNGHEPKFIPMKKDLDDYTYEEAIAGLNGLQTNAQTIDQIKKEKGSNSCQSLEKTIKFLALLDIKPSDLNQLNVIHVSGTKGKGSTCAFVESILRNNNFKTGFYSSPHLVAARERIRINGQPINKDQFARYFWTVYNTIEENKPEDLGMPPYFMFLTVMAFKMFLDQKVDVAVVEVGIGGEFDCTNVVPKPVVCGVTSLGLDHCSLLGNTIDRIAWQKAGIFKPGTTAFTVQQSPEAMKTLVERAKEKHATLYISPSFALYPQRDSIKLGINGQVQKLNASLAIQLSNFWMRKLQNRNFEPQTFITKDGSFADVLSLSKFTEGLKNCHWPGRFQIVKKDNVTYFLDGAHTAESMAHCSKWFNEESNALNRNGKSLVKFLIFNCTGERQAENLMRAIESKFNFAIFCPNRVSNVKDIHSDQSNFTISPQKEIDSIATNTLTWQKLNDSSATIKLTCLSDAVSFISQKCSSGIAHVLVTGSIHLVGGVLGLIDKDYV